MREEEKKQRCKSISRKKLVLHLLRQIRLVHDKNKHRGKDMVKGKDKEQEKDRGPEGNLLIKLKTTQGSPIDCRPSTAELHQ